MPIPKPVFADFKTGFYRFQLSVLSISRSENQLLLILKPVLAFCPTKNRFLPASGSVFPKRPKPVFIDPKTDHVFKSLCMYIYVLDLSQIDIQLQLLIAFMQARGDDRMDFICEVNLVLCQPASVYLRLWVHLWKLCK